MNRLCLILFGNGPLTRYVNLRVAYAPGIPGRRFPRYWVHRKPLVNDPGMHHGTCVTHVPWCMSGSLTRGDGENVPGIPGACTTRNFTYLARGSCPLHWSLHTFAAHPQVINVHVRQLRFHYYCHVIQNRSVNRHDSDKHIIFMNMIQLITHITSES